MRAYHDYYNTTINSTKQPSRQATAAREGAGAEGGGRKQLGGVTGMMAGGGGRKDAACTLQHDKRPGVRGRPPKHNNQIMRRPPHPPPRP